MAGASLGGLLEDIIARMADRKIERMERRLGRHHVAAYWVRGKGRGGRDVIRVDVTPGFYAPAARRPGKRAPPGGRRAGAEGEPERLVLGVLRGLLQGGELSVKLSGEGWEARGRLVSRRAPGRPAYRIEARPIGAGCGEARRRRAAGPGRKRG